MTKFYICRHGQTENNKHERLSGWIDTPLTDQGVQNTASSAGKLKGITFDKIVSSDLGRAFISAYLISRKIGYFDEIERQANLREVNYGDLGNSPFTGANIAYPLLTPEENTDYIPPNGESLAQMQSRVMQCIEMISQESHAKTILLVAHDGTINAVYASSTNQPIGLVDSNSHNGNDFVAEFVYEAGKVTSFKEILTEKL
mgnify:CR=1 FL=1